MGRYFFNVRRDDTVFEDHTGVVLADVAEAWQWAVKDAQTLLSDGVLDRTGFRYWMEICDAQHCVVVAFPIDRVTMQ